MIACAYFRRFIAAFVIFIAASAFQIFFDAAITRF